ncbi:hypothetical protein G7Y79_00026g058240 [Physcia stellaris]|nr:hypothetical protein G7Y79_00026g058240 [Physcia stellaris]
MASDTNSLLSSPDPLGLSLTEDPVPSSPTKSSRKPTTPRKALSDTNGNAQVQEFYLTTPSAPRISSSSPSKSSIKSKGAVSPWRIRVTVEAEPENAMMDSPSKRVAERTVTTTVPLKSAADSSPIVAKRGRGRPRKSLDGPVKRSATPKPKTSSRGKIVKDSTEEVTEDKSTDKIPSPFKARGRPRKSIGSSPATSAAKDLNPLELDQTLQNNQSENVKERPRSRGRRKAMTPTRKRSAPDSSTFSTPADDKHSLAVPANHSSVVQSSRSHAAEGRPAKRRSLDKSEETEDDQLPEAVKSPEVPNSQIVEQDLSRQQDALITADENMWRSMIRQDSLPPTSGSGDEGMESDGNGKDHEMIDNDPTDEHHEFDSILESEGFSMVSVSSLPSAQQQSGSSASHIAENFANGSRLDPSLSEVSVSMKPKNTSQLRTPSLTSSTSSMPPPPIPSGRPSNSPLSFTKTTDGTPKLVRVVRAGIALQGVISPSNSNSTNNLQSVSSASRSDISAPASSMASSQNRTDNLFDGFGAGTRRELRAGLRLGEELAKRQQREHNNEKIVERVEDDVFRQDVQPMYPHLPDTQESQSYSLRLPVPEQNAVYSALQNPQLPSPAGSIADDEDQMSWKASSPLANEPALPTKKQSVSIQDSNQKPVEPHSTPLEVRWQREREAVSKQIEEANTSQVVIIDSDDEDDARFGGKNDGEPSGDENDDALSGDENDDGGDIWQQEANSSKSMSEPSLQAADELLPVELPKPRRSKLPSPWRQDRQVVYSDELEPNDQSAAIQPKKEAVKAVQKGEVAKQQMHAELESSIHTPTEVAPKKPGRMQRQVKLRDEDHKVERPGWRPVKGRLQTPAKKTLRNVLAKQYEEETLSDVNDEDEDVGDDDQEERTLAKQNDEGTVSDVNEEDEDDLDDDQEELTNHAEASDTNLTSRLVNHGDSSSEDWPVAEGSSAMSVEGSVEGSVEYESEEEWGKSIVQMSRTPPGSPPQHLFSTLYVPPPPEPTSTSWLTSLTTYIPTLRTPASTPIPNAANLDPAHWNLQPHGPLYTHLPWDNTHFRVFYPYFETQMARPGTYPFKPYSGSAALLSTPLWARNNYGWVRYLSKSDLGLVEKFMEVLRLKGVERRPGLYWTGDKKKIDELEVAKKLFDYWQDGVMHGTCRVETEIGNRIGNVPRTKIPVTPSKIKSPRRWKKEVFLVE